MGGMVGVCSVDNKSEFPPSASVRPHSVYQSLPAAVGSCNHASPLILVALWYKSNGNLPGQARQGTQTAATQKSCCLGGRGHPPKGALQRNVMLEFHLYTVWE